MSSAARIFRDGRLIRETVLTADQAASFVTLADAVRTVQHQTASSAKRPDPYEILRNLESRLDPTYQERLAARPRDILAGDGSLAVFHDGPEPTPAQNARLRAIKPDGGDFTMIAYGLGMILRTGLIPSLATEFDLVELTDDAPAGSGAPQVRAYVRWRV